MVERMKKLSLKAEMSKMVGRKFGRMLGGKPAWTVEIVEVTFLHVHVQNTVTGRKRSIFIPRFKREYALVKE